VKDGRTDRDLLAIVRNNFNLRPGFIIRSLNLLRPIYGKTSCYSHFGRNDPDFTWETPKTLDLTVRPAAATA
jgi:S-adenosylmethionine synthetase